MLNGSWLTRDDELVNNSRYRSEIQWPSALQVLRSFVSRFRIFDQQYEISLQYKRNRFEISLLDQRIFAQLTENSTNFRLRDHEILPEISAIFRLNNSRNSAKFVCILFAQYCTRKKEIRVLLSGVEPKTFRLLVRMLYHWATGASWELRPLN